MVDQEISVPNPVPHLDIPHRAIISFLFSCLAVSLLAAKVFSIHPLSSLDPTLYGRLHQPPGTPPIFTWNVPNKVKKENVSDLLSSTPRRPIGDYSPCDFDMKRINFSCPRYIRMRLGSAGLGDRFSQILVQNLFALDTHAVAIAPEGLAVGKHGNYSWAKTFFNFNKFMTDEKSVTADTKIARTIKIPANVRVGNGATLNRKLALLRISLFTTNETLKQVTLYQDAMEIANSECNVIVELHGRICDGSCYYVSEPHLQRFRHVLQCAILRANSGQFPTLLYEASWYNVVIHLRTGDINLHNSDSAFFARLKAQLDAILERYHVHYTLLAEAPEKEDGPAFDFLADIFREDVGSKTKVSFANTLDVPTSLLHMMNADMLITTGSSFPYIAATLSPKPVVVFGRPKEHNFFKGLLREDFILLEDSGELIKPSISEIEALVAMKYIESHGKIFPRDYAFLGTPQSTGTDDLGG